MPADAQQAASLVGELVERTTQHSFGPLLTLTLTLESGRLLVEVLDTALDLSRTTRAAPASPNAEGPAAAPDVPARTGSREVLGGTVRWAALSCASTGHEAPERHAMPDTGPADERDTAASTRDEQAWSRDDAGATRDDEGRDRDNDLRGRDVDAAARDTAADLRDTRAVSRERDQRRFGSSIRSERAAEQSAKDRCAAALDRDCARRDREAGHRGRQRADSDRVTSDADRVLAAADRRLSQQDREAAATDRLDSSIDSLTGAYVRGPGLRQLEREIDRADRLDERVTVAFVDVDHLKALNDARGHAAGDRLLLRVAASLRHRLRPYDLVVRYGGDEFVCVLTGIGHEDAEPRFDLVNHDLEGHGSVTVGAVTMRRAESASALVERADAALYGRRAARRSP